MHRITAKLEQFDALGIQALLVPPQFRVIPIYRSFFSNTWFITSGDVSSSTWLLERVLSATVLVIF